MDSRPRSMIARMEYELGIGIIIFYHLLHSPCTFLNPSFKIKVEDELGRLKRCFGTRLSRTFELHPLYMWLSPVESTDYYFRDLVEFLVHFRPIPIGNGSFRVKAIIVIGVVGYGYIWWKGWKISDMMFVTRRGFSYACNSVGKQVDMVSSSLAATKRHLSSRLDRVDSSVDECKALTAATQVEVSRINGDLSGIQEDVESVILSVQNMETKLVKMEESQDFARKGIYHLCKFTENLELTQGSQSSSQRAIGPTQHTAVTRMSSAPSLALEPPSPSTSSEPPKVLHTPKAVSIAGLKDLQISNTIKDRTLRTSSSMASSETSSVEEPSSSSSGSSGFSWRLPGLSVLTRTRSTAN